MNAVLGVAFVWGQLALTVLLFCFAILWRLKKRHGTTDEVRELRAGTIFILFAIAVNTLVAVALMSFGAAAIMAVGELIFLSAGLWKILQDINAKKSNKL